MSEIISRPEQASTGEDFRLVTYYNYVKAWNIAYEERYGSGESGINLFNERICELSKCSRNKNVFAASLDEKDYTRGLLTLQLMRNLPVDTYTNLTFSANLWLPVQSYYAVYGVGLALLKILLQDPPQTNKGFRSCFTDVVLENLFPYPFNGLCEGGPEQADFSFRNLDTSAAKVKAQINIANPVKDRIDDYIGKSLSTTRKKNLDERFKEQRRKDVKSGCTRRNLKKEDKAKIYKKEIGTSICDFIYRMRLRSNYHDPMMYLSATSDKTHALSHYKDLLLLTRVIIEGIKTIIEVKIGRKEIAQIEEKLTMTEISDIPFQ